MVLVPGARIVFDGRDITAQLLPTTSGRPPSLSGGLISLTVDDQAGAKSDTVEFEIDNGDHHRAPKKGAEVKVWLGWEPTPVFQGTFQVESWSKRGPHRHLKVTAKAAELTTAIRAPKSRSHHGLTLGQIASKIAAEHNLQPVVDAGLEGLVIPHVDQQHESNLAFMNRMAERVGAVLKVANGKLLVTRKAAKRLPSGKAKPKITITPDMLTDWDFVSHSRGECDAVVTSYRDDGAGKRRHVHAGVRKPKGHPTHRDRRLYGSKEEAEAAAKAQLDDLKRGRKTGDINAPGLPNAFAEGLADFRGFDDPDIEGEFRIRSVKHTFSARGFKTTMSVENGKEPGTSEVDD